MIGHLARRARAAKRGVSLLEFERFCVEQQERLERQLEHGYETDPLEIARKTHDITRRGLNVAGNQDERRRAAE